MRAPLWLLPMSALACAGRGETVLEFNYNSGTLDSFRSAIPTAEQLIAGVPATAGSDSLSDDSVAVLAGQGVVFARGINQTTRDIARTLRLLVQAEPDHFDTEREEFVWGPWQMPSGPGQARLSIRRDDAAADFEYSYTLSRQMPNEPHTRTVVVWGGTHLDPEDPEQGSGLTAWDLDANAAFEAVHGEGHELDPAVGQGRFAMIHGYASHGTDSVFFHRATFRDFVAPGGDPASLAAPVSVDHFYGRVAEPTGTVVDFLHSEIDSDLCGSNPTSCFGREPRQGHAERFVFGEFVVDSGSGRAEVVLSGGDLSTEVRMTECWNAALTRTSYLLRTSDSAVQMMPSATCAGRAAQSSEELGLPTADDVPPWLLYTLGCAVDDNCTKH